MKALAKSISCSETALRPIFMGAPTKKLDWTREELLAGMERYKSVRFLAHVKGVSEGLVRACAKEHDVELAELIDYSFGDNSNSKGRRAELEYAKMRGPSRILEDKNLTDGSQARWDFDDAFYGKVNVKSSKRYKYRAETRKDDPFYWKISTTGAEEADYLICMCYDDAMMTLLGVFILDANNVGESNTYTISGAKLNDPAILHLDKQPPSA